MASNDQTFLHDTDALEIEDSLRADYLAIRAAIIELATGQRTVRLTINGKTAEYGQVDISTLRTLRDELADELRAVAGRTSYKPNLVMTSKGF